jgi:hypothetical protein
MLSKYLPNPFALPFLTSAHFKFIYQSEISTTTPWVRVLQRSASASRPYNSIVGLLPHSPRHASRSINFTDATRQQQQPWSNFNIVLERTFQQEGLDDFCLPDLLVPSNLAIADGANVTLQIVMDGEGGGGLYNVRRCNPVREPIW